MNEEVRILKDNYERGTMYSKGQAMYSKAQLGKSSECLGEVRNQIFNVLKTNADTQQRR